MGWHTCRKTLAAGYRWGRCGDQPGRQIGELPLYGKRTNNRSSTAARNQPKPLARPSGRQWFRPNYGSTRLRPLFTSIPPINPMMNLPGWSVMPGKTTCPILFWTSCVTGTRNSAPVCSMGNTAPITMNLIKIFLYRFASNGRTASLINGHPSPVKLLYVSALPWGLAHHDALLQPDKSRIRWSAGQWASNV